MMYCPNCAAPQSDEQKFCRSCGFDLQAISQMFTSESVTDDPDELDSSRSARAQSQKARFQTLGMITIMFALMIGCLIPISLGLFPNWPGRIPLILVLSGLAGLHLFGGSILLFYADTLPEVKASKKSPPIKSLRRADTTNKLLPVGQAEPVTSITEHTTDLLQTVEAKDSQTRT